MKHTTFTTTLKLRSTRKLRMTWKLQMMMVLIMVGMGICEEQVKASTPHNVIKAQQSYKQNQGAQIKDRIQSKKSYIQQEIQFSQDNPDLPCCVGTQKPGITCRWCTSELPELKSNIEYRKNTILPYRKNQVETNVQNKESNVQSRDNYLPGGSSKECICGQHCSGQSVQTCLKNGSYQTGLASKNSGDNYLPGGSSKECICGQHCSGQSVQTCLKNGSYKVAN